MTKPSPVQIQQPTPSTEAIEQAAHHAPPRLTFYFDPMCPWAWRAAQWIWDVQGQLPLDVQWKFFSLATANNVADPALNTPLRVLAFVRRQGSNAAVAHLYRAMGTVIHEGGVDIHAPGALNDAVRSALVQSALPPDVLRQALEDPSTLQEIRDEYREAKRRYRAYGVPWLVLGNRDFGFQGPVILQPPVGQVALDLWQHVSWLLAQSYFYELKRER